MTNRVFLDASFWIVYRDEKELLHPVARRTIGELFHQRVHFVTTLPVACEVHAYFVRSRPKREAILKDFCENPVVMIEEISHRDQTNALELLRHHRDKTFSLCDALSFVTMQRLHLGRALAFDNHFRQFGEFEIIPQNFP
jgi:predicted nucleic acid-binding protein